VNRDVGLGKECVVVALCWRREHAFWYIAPDFVSCPRVAQESDGTWALQERDEDFLGAVAVPVVLVEAVANCLPDGFLLLGQGLSIEFAAIQTGAVAAVKEGGHLALSLTWGYDDGN